MKGPSITPLLLVFFYVPFAFSVVDKWTPDYFDWNRAEIKTSPGSYSGIWMDSQAIPNTINVTGLVRAPRTDIDGHEFIAVAAFLGFAWRAASIAIAGVSLHDTIKTCNQTVNQQASAGYCVKGVFGTIMAFGGAYSATKKTCSSRRSRSPSSSVSC